MPKAPVDTVTSYELGYAVVEVTKNAADHVALAAYGGKDAWESPKQPFADKLAAARAAHAASAS